MRLIFISIFIFFFSYSAFSQISLSESLQSFTNYLDTINSISYKIGVYNYSSSGILDSSFMKVEKKDGITLVSEGEVLNYLKNDLSLYVDVNEEIIILNAGLNPKISGIPSQVKLFEEAEKLASKVEVKESGSLRIYSLYFKDKLFSYLKAVIDTSRNTLSSMDFYLTDAVPNEEDVNELPTVRIKVELKDYNFDLNSLSTPFEEFLELKEDSVKVNNKYSNYQFLNNYEYQ